MATDYKLNAAEREIASKMLNDIAHLTLRWHLGFTESERVTVEKALMAAIFRR